MILFLLDEFINFYLVINKFIVNLYEYMKIRAFNNKITYYAIYNIKTRDYNVINDYNKLYYILYYFIFNHVGLRFDDIKIITKFKDMYIVISHIKNGKKYDMIINNSNYDECLKLINNNDNNNREPKIIYAYTDLDDDLTDSFEKYKKTLFSLNLSAEHIYNMIGPNKKSITLIKYMDDTDYDEKIII